MYGNFLSEGIMLHFCLFFYSGQMATIIVNRVFTKSHRWMVVDANVCAHGGQRSMLKYLPQFNLYLIFLVFTTGSC